MSSLVTESLSYYTSAYPVTIWCNHIGQSGSLFLSPLVGGQSLRHSSLSPSQRQVSQRYTPRNTAGWARTRHCFPQHSRPTYGVAVRALQFEVTVELVWGRALALHLPADMEGAAPGAVFAAVNDVAPTALKTRDTYLGCDRLQLLKGHASEGKMKQFVISSQL